MLLRDIAITAVGAFICISFCLFGWLVNILSTQENGKVITIVVLDEVEDWKR